MLNHTSFTFDLILNILALEMVCFIGFHLLLTCICFINYAKDGRPEMDVL